MHRWAFQFAASTGADSGTDSGFAIAPRLHSRPVAEANAKGDARTGYTTHGFQVAQGLAERGVVRLVEGGG